MSNRPYLALTLAFLCCLTSAYAAVWWFTSTSNVATSQNTMPSQTDAISNANDQSRREKFFGGDPERNVRGGQEMKPRW